MALAKLMSLDEVKQCDFAYLVYEKEDPEVHCFLRMHNFEGVNGFISFDRPISTDKSGNIFGTAHSQPHLFENNYGSVWFAFDGKPDPNADQKCKEEDEECITSIPTKTAMNTAHTGNSAGIAMVV